MKKKQRVQFTYGNINKIGCAYFTKVKHKIDDIVNVKIIIKGKSIIVEAFHGDLKIANI